MHLPTNVEVPNVNGKLKARGLAGRGLTEAQRVALAASSRTGDLAVSNFSATQASALFGVPVTVVDAEIKRRKEDRLSEAAAYLASVWLATSPLARTEAIKSIGIDTFYAALDIAIE